MSTEIRRKVEEYFASLNPIAKRIMHDLAKAKEEVGDKWDSLSIEEQDEALWRAVVDSETESKFEKPTEPVIADCFPNLKIKSGERVVVDEEASAGKPFGVSWRDEHSAPFCWETQSQMNLTFCEPSKRKEKEKSVSSTTLPILETPKEEKKDEVKRHQTIKRPEVPPPPVPPHATSPVPPSIPVESSPPVPPHAEKPEQPIYAKVVKRKSSSKTLVISELKLHKKAMEEMKPAVPPRMSLELESIDLNKSKDSEGIPKTGFDFLDNW